ncbi:hypothetical protein [Pseudoalteromonas luteoviolacea]|uniref:Uncharacterized protein n=1 Tax=Pseudoalteromonas luteoviolacea DSM 6061 TaxID=1365250 RepID=A0A166W8M4_9GAMM|nr:hypothetical protein [Pseudoalteromonas luteoviolacea]KZN36219.1 hypothetical protein N475_17640 [Pseudoalteromonas luteoviolacea DSM 6061]KZN51511.1 hypothetical protein N474_24015 [Pseudoalteromonas luteoviolacea CPMOR-2]MBE0386663.1 hypothetical protein [Pseudoalteromonas luteoviolacea DSM 6061]TQF71511.1 hypothetical protein FLM44_10640 [Pseudoalteromonas luteoviolacea]
MPLLIVLLLIYCLVICFLLAIVINGHSLTGFEKKVRSFLVKSKEEAEVPDELYNKAYEIVMDLGEALENENDMAKHDGVQMAFKRVEDFRDDSKEFNYQSQKSTETKPNLKVVK